MAGAGGVGSCAGALVSAPLSSGTVVFASAFGGCAEAVAAPLLSSSASAGALVALAAAACAWAALVARRLANSAQLLSRPWFIFPYHSGGAIRSHRPVAAN